MEVSDFGGGGGGDLVRVLILRESYYLGSLFGVLVIRESYYFGVCIIGVPKFRNPPKFATNPELTKLRKTPKAQKHAFSRSSLQLPQTPNPKPPQTLNPETPP